VAWIVPIAVLMPALMRQSLWGNMAEFQPEAPSLAVRYTQDLGRIQEVSSCRNMLEGDQRQLPMRNFQMGRAPKPVIAGLEEVFRRIPDPRVSPIAPSSTSCVGGTRSPPKRRGRVPDSEGMTYAQPRR